MLKIKPSLKKLISFLVFFSVCLFAYSQADNDYYRLIDSADIRIDVSSEKALSFLDSIPKPIEENIVGRVADYYAIKAIIHDEFNEYAKFHQCTILAIKYAEKENNFCVAGEAYVNLFSNLYFIKKDTTAFKYLDKARAAYKKCDYEYGALEVEQVEAYAMYLDGEHKACNDFLLSKVETYKSVLDEVYYYMFSLYMITSNYIYLNDFENAHKYFEAFKGLKDNPNIIKYNFFSFEASINSSFSCEFFEQKQIDSTRFYLKESSSLTYYMTEDVLIDYYQSYADLNEYLGHDKESKVYIDSLRLFQNKMYDKTIEASFEVSDSILKAESELILQNEEKTLNNVLAGFSVVVLLLLSLFSFIFYRKQKKKLDIYSHDTNNSLSYLKSNNEQLAVKVFGLEEYIKNLKKEVKNITRTESSDNQKEKIKDLYKNLHINSSTVLDKSENHLDLVNQLNIDFFKKIKKNHPQLNKSEIITCFYLIMEFSNKEIAVFLNTTVRSVESRRYRISKKINLNQKEETLLEHLQNTFSDTLKSNDIN